MGLQIEAMETVTKCPSGVIFTKLLALPQQDVRAEVESLCSAGKDIQLQGSNVIAVGQMEDIFQKYGYRVCRLVEAGVSDQFLLLHP